MITAVKCPGHKGGTTRGSTPPATGLPSITFVIMLSSHGSPSSVTPATVSGVVLSEVNRNFHTTKSGDEKGELPCSNSV